MNPENTAAILLRRFPYSETSVIVTWLSREAGLLKTIVKGARRPKSAFAARLDLFFHADISFARSRRSDLHTLREISLRETFEGLRKHYRRVQAAAYFVELLEIVTEPEAEVGELYDLMLRALRFLDQNDPDRHSIVHFERELVRLLGFGPHETDVDPAELRRNPNAPARAIYNVYHRLPKDRQKLLESLGT